jgi:hypothetical protein
MDRHMMYTEMMGHIAEAQVIMNDICESTPDNSCINCPLRRKKKNLCDRISRIK